jgi:predicted nuclease of predicted toxin-antitoxin system
VRDLGLERADDDVLLVRAAEGQQVIVSADTDFGALLALRQETKPSVILFRQTANRRPERQVAVLMANWEVAKALTQTDVELVLIHPFREGNGRIARALSTVMGLQAGLPPLDFRSITGKATFPRELRTATTPSARNLTSSAGSSNPPDAASAFHSNGVAAS